MTSTSDPVISKNRCARVIAFYLPQYHPIPENDAWWGKGFTEWTNVTKAKPLFRGHRQPILPGELGFYDLRLKEVRTRQAQLAKSAGIEGFCYWHYWFGNGKKILQRVTDEVIQSGEPDYPFCLAWANESWTGRWHGLDNKTLIEQTYPGRTDEELHFYSILPALQDRRYIEIDGRKLFLIYRPELLPSVQSFINHWNELARKNGINQFYFVSANDAHGLNEIPELEGIIPRHIQSPIHKGQKLNIRNVSYLALKTLGFGSGIDSISARLSGRYPLRTSYSSFAKEWKKLPRDIKTIPCLIPNWDNTARSGRRGYVLQDSRPDLFSSMIDWALDYVKDRPYEMRLIFLKSWNEWAEGNYIEPDSVFGSGYLDALQSRIFYASN